MEFAILGPVEARVDGAALPLGGPKQRALLAILLLNANAPVSRDRLIAGLWGESAPPSAAQSLDSYVSRLRRVLGTDRIVRRAPGYLVAVGPDELDLDRFEQRLAEGSPHAALDEWRGPALADVLYEPFAPAEAARLEERRLLALESRVDADLVAGAGADLVPELDALVHEHPLRERLLGQWMLALYRAGRQAEALAAMRDARHRLVSELGIEPGPQLRELEQRILLHDPDLGVGRWLPLPAGRRGRALLGATLAIVLAVTAAALFIGAGTDAPPAAARAGAHRAVAISVASGRPTGAVELPGAAAAALTADDSLWIADPDDQLVLRLDPSSGQIVDRIPVPDQPGALAAGGGAIWVAATLGRAVRRIDPATGQVTQTVALPGASAGAIAYRAGAIWVADPSSRTLVVVDARSGAVRGTHQLELRPTAIAATADAVWVADHDDGVVAEVDPASGRTLQTVRVGNGPSALAATPDALWVANTLDSTVSRVSAATGAVAATIAVDSGPVALTAAKGSLWVASQHAGTVTRIDTARDRVTGTTAVGGRPLARPLPPASSAASRCHRLLEPP